MNAGRSGQVNIAGTVIDTKERTTRTNKPIGFVRLSDASETLEITVFSEVLTECRPLLEAGRCLFIRANAQLDGERKSLVGNTVELLDQVVADAGIGVRVFVASAASLPAVHQVLMSAKAGGKGRVKLVSQLNAASEAEIDLPGRFAVSPALLQELKAIPGIVAVEEI